MTTQSAQAVSSTYFVDEAIARSLAKSMGHLETTLKSVNSSMKITHVPTKSTQAIDEVTTKLEVLDQFHTVQSQVTADKLFELERVFQQRNEAQRIMAESMNNLERLDQRLEQLERESKEKMHELEQIEQERTVLQRTATRHGKQRIATERIAIEMPVVQQQQVQRTVVEQQTPKSKYDDLDEFFQPAVNSNDNFSWDYDWILEDQLARAQRYQPVRDLTADKQLATVLDQEEKARADALAEQFAKDQQLAQYYADLDRQEQVDQEALRLAALEEQAIRDHQLALELSRI